MVTVSFIGIGILAFGASQIENLQSVSLNLQQDCCVIWKIIFLVLDGFRAQRVIVITYSAPDLVPCSTKYKSIWTVYDQSS